jgi:cytochrome c oxidase subunit 2
MTKIAELLGVPLNASAHGDQVDAVIGAVHILMFVLFVGWGAFFVYVLIRFRRKRNPSASYTGTKSHASRYLEGAVALVEIVLLFGLSVPVWARQIANPATAEDALTVRVVAQQFAWNIHYPGEDGIFGRRAVELITAGNPLGVDRTDLFGADDIVSVGELAVPVDEVIRIELSTLDVIHSLYLPEMRVKQDAIPGMVIPLSFTATETGNWEIACAQLCGVSHYKMRGFFNVLDRRGYEAWLVEQTAQL